MMIEDNSHGWRRLQTSIASVSLSRLSVVVVIIASAVDLLQMTLSLPVIKSSRTDTSGGVGRVSYATRERERSGRYVSPHYETLVTSLEAVGVLDVADQSDCFVLENVTKEWRPSPAPPGVDGGDGAASSVVEVSLQLRRFRIPAGVKGREKGRDEERRRGKWSDDNSATTEEEKEKDGEEGEEGGGNVCLEWMSRTTTVSSSSTQTTTTTKVGEGERKNGLDEEERSGSRNRSDSAVAPEEPKIKQKPQHEEHSGLNKRQILVISTCSTVIGAFFVTAFILRIRNYMKRSKQDKDGTRRHVRAASMPHQRTHHGSLDHFANNENHRRWSQFNPFATDR